MTDPGSLFVLIFAQVFSKENTKAMKGFGFFSF